MVGMRIDEFKAAIQCRLLHMETEYERVHAMRAKMGKRVRTTYDAAADAYAAQFQHELDNKPLDRELLERFAETVRAKGAVWEVGCGPGQVGDHVRRKGLIVHGADVSFEPLRLGRSLYGHPPYVQSDMLALAAADNSLAGILAFYAICHLAEDELVHAFREIHRTLRPRGTALITFHIGDECKHVDEFLDQPADIEFNFFQVDRVVAAIAEAGFGNIEPIEREPYPGTEHPSRRAYVFARKRA